MNNSRKPFVKTVSTSCEDKEFSSNEPKRQKLEPKHQNNIARNELPSKITCNSNDLQKSPVLSNSDSNYELKDGDFHNVSCLPASDATIAVKCVFCQSSCESEVFGPMIHFSKGKILESYHATQSNVAHAHTKCIDWTPLVYYNGDIIEKVDSEISRALKIKCSKCRKKGAALGCYVKSCHKSFHFPCAIKTRKCRFDCENFLLLCPVHFSSSFPTDRCKTEEQVKNAYTLATKLEDPEILKDIPPKVERNEGTWTDAYGTSKEWILCGSALSTSDCNLLEKFAKNIGAVVTKNWKQQVTHLIASTDDSGACRRNIKYLKAILGGKWILSIDWVKECMEVLHPVAENNYEITHDIHGFCYGPKKGRIRAMEKASPLFSGLRFCFSGHFEPSHKMQLEDLITVAGGTILNKDDNGLLKGESSAESSFYIDFVIYSLLAPSDCKQVDYPELIKRRHEEAEVLASGTGAWVIPQTWIHESIIAGELEPVSHP